MTDDYEWTTVIFLLALFMAWMTHVVTTISSGAYVLLLVGALFFPVGIIHGIMVWFGLV